MTRTFWSCSASSTVARSRSISTATTRPARAASGRVSAPRPGPISRNVSSFVASSASMTFATHAASRKCWPKRLRGGGPDKVRPPRPALLFVISLAAPIALLDLFDFFLAQAEVVTDFVNQRFADHRPGIVIVLAIFLDGFLKNRDAVWERVAVPPGPLGKGRALVETVQG